MYDGDLFWSGEGAGYKGFSENEIICMEYEIAQGDKCSLSFYNETNNNQFIRKFDLPKFVTSSKNKIKNWYPVFANGHFGLHTVTVVRY